MSVDRKTQQKNLLKLHGVLTSPDTNQNDNLFEDIKSTKGRMKVCDDFKVHYEEGDVGHSYVHYNEQNIEYLQDLTAYAAEAMGGRAKRGQSPLARSPGDFKKNRFYHLLYKLSEYPSLMAEFQHLFRRGGGTDEPTREQLDFLEQHGLDGKTNVYNFCQAILELTSDDLLETLWKSTGAMYDDFQFSFTSGC